MIALSVILIAVTIDTSRLILARGGSGSSTALVVNEWLGAAANVAIVVLPWLVGGWVPAPSAFIASLVIALAAGFMSTAALIMTEFDATSGSRKGRLFDRGDERSDS